MEMKIKVVTPTMKVNDDLFYKMQLEFEETMEEIISSKRTVGEME